MATHPSISGNGQLIVFVASHQGRSDIYLYNRDIRQSQNLTANLPAEVRNPTISADGTKIAFEYSNNGHWDISLYDTVNRQIVSPQLPM
jgi:Tol biopolymer transport system component